MTVRERAGVAVDLKLSVHQVDDPIVGDAGPCIVFRLPASVFEERRVGDFHEQIDIGRQIGNIGSTGRSTGPHLHYEVHHNGQQINPENFLTLN